MNMKKTIPLSKGLFIATFAVAIAGFCLGAGAYFSALYGMVKVNTTFASLFSDYTIIKYLLHSLAYIAFVITYATMLAKCDHYENQGGVLLKTYGIFLIILGADTLIEAFLDMAEAFAYPQIFYIICALFYLIGGILTLLWADTDLRMTRSVDIICCFIVGVAKIINMYLVYTADGLGLFTIGYATLVAFQVLMLIFLFGIRDKKEISEAQAK